ncbi:MAG TPA: DUF4423 domain-containing protein [Bacteriovoracaceae bacterium]|nr:DUF4423 domain-containing protein [Bacteriovoracaceae bacterium]
MREEIVKRILETEYLKRKIKNPAYSLRAYGKFLGIGIASLSDCLAMKRTLSAKNVKKIVERLAISPAEAATLLNDKKRGDLEALNRVHLKEDQFNAIVDWYHSAIVEMASIQGHKASGEWIAERLGISHMEAKAAITRLINLGLISIDTKKNKIKRLTPPVSALSDIPSAAIRTHRKQVFDLAKESIENDPLERREFRDITMAIDPKRLSEAKEMLGKYARKICKYLESGEAKELYCLTIGLFPLDKQH